jgi:5-methylcytosine-specific restriction endonuclease McrA
MRKKGLNVEVDHIIPISHKDVCGLHVPWNLSIIPTKDNRVKTNKINYVVGSELL